jgi:uncharacterized membrane protein
MALLILGLVLFLGAHSARIFADGWRAGVIARLGPGPWKGLYALASLAGFVLIIVGYGQARGGAPLIAPVAALRPVAMALIVAGFIGVTAAYWPGNHVKTLLRDPMVIGVGLWALGHLLVRTTPAALVLFGAFLVWTVADLVSLRARATTAPAPVAPAKALNTVLVVIVGAAVAAAFALWLHRPLIGVAPLG